MEESFIALLLADPSIAARLSARISWGMSPQGQGRPYCVLQVVSRQPDYTLGGKSGYEQTRIQGDVYAEKYTDSKLAARSILRKVSGYRGGIFKGIFVDGERDLPAADAGQITNLFRTSFDLIIHHS